MLPVGLVTAIDVGGTIYIGGFLLLLWICFGVWLGFFSPWGRSWARQRQRIVAIIVIAVQIVAAGLLALSGAKAFVWVGFWAVALYVLSPFLASHVAAAKGRTSLVWFIATFLFGGWAFLALLLDRSEHGANSSCSAAADRTFT